MAAIAKSPAATNMLNDSPIFHVNEAADMNDNQLQQSMEKLIKAMEAFEEELEANFGEGGGQRNATNTTMSTITYEGKKKCTII